MGAAESTTREGFAPDHRVPVDFDDLNFYEILGISEDAPAEEVKRAYRQRVLQHHPDKNLDDPEGAHKRFKQVQDAFETLIDDDKRRHYDYTRQKSSAEIPSQTRECDPKNVPESFGHTKGDSPTESWYEWIFGQIPKSKFVYESYSSCNSPEPGISSRDIVEFLNSIGSFSWYGGSKDAFPIFRDFFACLAHDEWLLSRKHCPPFGCAHSPWTRAGWEGQELRDINVNTHGPEVREFYDFWMEFETRTEGISENRVKLHKDVSVRSITRSFEVLLKLSGTKIRAIFCMLCCRYAGARHKPRPRRLIRHRTRRKRTKRGGRRKGIKASRALRHDPG